MIVVYSFTQSMGAWLSWMTGISLLVYGLVFAGTFFVAFLYWLSLYFTRIGSAAAETIVGLLLSNVQSPLLPFHGRWA
jgi:hypothetical protein